MTGTTPDTETMLLIVLWFHIIQCFNHHSLVRTSDCIINLIQVIAHVFQKDINLFSNTQKGHLNPYAIKLLSIVFSVKQRVIYCKIYIEKEDII